MSDSYLAISQIANNDTMCNRMYAAVTQQSRLGEINISPYQPQGWTDANKYVWASSPGWGEAWKYAQDSHGTADVETYDPGQDEAVITDGMILAAVQALG